MPGEIRILTLLLILSCAVSAQEINGLTARYLFKGGEGLNDITGNYAKIVGAIPVEDRFGNPGDAYYLQGNYGSYINLGTGSDLKPAQGTISLWFKMDNVMYLGKGSEYNPIIITKSVAGDDFYEAYFIGCQLSNKRMLMAATLSELNQVSVHSTDMVKLREWQHIVMTYDDDYVNMYIDGVFNNRMIKGFPTTFLENDSVMVGNTANTKNVRFFSGCIDDIQIFNRLLSPEEIALLYHAPDPNRYRPVIRWFVIILLALVIAAIVILLVVTRYKKALEREKERSALQRQMFEMEMHVIKAQMNPHFIFNAMNSVQQFILAGDNKNAHKYLGKFSKLLRKTLESNTNEFISLENEIEILAKYIEIEALRFEHSFTYEIITDAQIMTIKIKIPQMLIQPVVENAIWHGLLPKKDKGALSIIFEHIDDKSLRCIVDDNGVGRGFKKAEEHVLKEKSLAVNFIEQRLALMKKEWKGDYKLTIMDKVDENGNSTGTSVHIIIPVINE